MLQFLRPLPYSSAKQNTMASGRKLKILTLAEKGKLLDALENGTKMCDAAEQFGIGKSSVSRIWKLKDSICANLGGTYSSVLEACK